MYRGTLLFNFCFDSAMMAEIEQELDMNRDTYFRLGIVDIKTITDLHASVYSDRMESEPRTELFGRKVKLFSKGTRLKTFFVHGHVCSACGLEASYYAVERPAHTDESFPYHLNLWGIDDTGKEVLFTHDHTLARSAGGKDSIKNTTTMCRPCNFAKSLVEKRGR